MLNDKISVIVAAYNIEKYIERCIDSLRNQTYEKMEIILIDDGSVDSTGYLCDMAAQCDKRISCIHKENGGLSSARNTGIKKASGNYITFVDGDDWVEKEYIETLYKNLTGEGADLSILGYAMIWENGSLLNKTSATDYLVLNKHDAIHELFVQKKITCMSWTKLYKRELFNDIVFPEGELFEDTAIALDIFKKCDKVVYSGKPYYYYFQRKGSIVNSRFRPEKMSLLTYCEKMISYSENLGGEFDYEVHSYFFSSAMMLLFQIYGSEEDFHNEKKVIIDKIRKRRRFILLNKYFPIRRKLILYMMISPVSFDRLLYWLWSKWMAR